MSARPDVLIPPHAPTIRRAGVLAPIPTPGGNAREPKPRPNGAARPAGTDEHTVALLNRMATHPDAQERRRARAELIERQQPFATFLARRFRNRGESLEDLCQVAMVGLIKAVDGFDASRGDSFSGYAIPTILGELRRHFRDKGWAIRVPRPQQELRARIISTTEELSHTLSRSPDERDLAQALGVSAEEIRAALIAAQAYTTNSLQAPARGDHGCPALAEALPDIEPGYAVVEAREVLRRLLGELPERERRILGLRYFGQLTQAEIAAELGISQMHVSRLIQRSLCSLREQLALTG